MHLTLLRRGAPGGPASGAADAELASSSDDNSSDGEPGKAGAEASSLLPRALAQGPSARAAPGVARGAGPPLKRARADSLGSISSQRPRAALAARGGAAAAAAAAALGASSSAQVRKRARAQVLVDLHGRRTRWRTHSFALVITSRKPQPH